MRNIISLSADFKDRLQETLCAYLRLVIAGSRGTFARSPLHRLTQLIPNGEHRA